MFQDSSTSWLQNLPVKDQIFESPFYSSDLPPVLPHSCPSPSCYSYFLSHHNSSQFSLGLPLVFAFQTWLPASVFSFFCLGHFLSLSWRRWTFCVWVGLCGIVTAISQSSISESNRAWISLHITQLMDNLFQFLPKYPLKFKFCLKKLVELL